MKSLVERLRKELCLYRYTASDPKRIQLEDDLARITAFEASVQELEALVESEQERANANANHIVALEAELAETRKALAFAASAIKSGEPWTDTCEQVIGRALAASWRT